MFARSIIPQKIRRKWRATRARIRGGSSPTSSITHLETSFSPKDTLRALSHYKWSLWDAQYLVLAILFTFCLSLMKEPSPFARTFVAGLVMSTLLIPASRQFFLPFLPIIGYLVFFFSCKYIPTDIRPLPFTRLLPSLENILYGANLSNILSAHKHVVLDVLAWFPYGIGHFGAPAVVSAVMFIFGPPGSTPVFAKTFGWMNIIGVAIQLLIPCSPPWYENKYGLAPANYGISGSPAGLARIDELFGIDMYTSTFTASPQVFGAFPSMHAANVVIEALFLSHLFPHLTGLWFGYALWLMWATMYLSHHYAVDLVAGALLASICFYISRAKWIPRIQAGKSLRWDYDFVEIGDVDMSYAELNTIEEYYMPQRSDDEWTVGESSSIHSASDENDYFWSKETTSH